MRPFNLLLLILLFSCDSREKKLGAKQVTDANARQLSVTNFDTLPNGKRLLDNLDSGMVLYYKEVVGSDTLKGGYITCYGIDDSMRYFYLRKENTLYLLNQSTRYQSPWSLGTLEKDFETFFITRVDNGNGVPGTYQVFDKKSGKNLLGDRVEAWNFRYLGDTLFFLYDNHVVNIIGNYIDRKKADSIFLYNTKSGRRKGFQLPPENPTDVLYYDIKKITKNSLTISRTEHYSGDQTLMKYNR